MKSINDYKKSVKYKTPLTYLEEDNSLAYWRTEPKRFGDIVDNSWWEANEQHQ